MADNGPQPQLEGESLAKKTYRGVAWTTGQSVGGRLIALGATGVLARLLAPEDFGLLGMVAVVLVFLQTFADGGLSVATIQKKSLTIEQVHNLFWANTGLGGLMWAASALAGVPLTWFFGRPELQSLATVLGAGFLLSGVTVQPMALLQREMLFGRRAAIELISTVVGAVVGIVMAVKGTGYWALAGQSLALQISRVILVFGLYPYRPKWPRAVQGTAALLTFGGLVSASGIVNYFARNLDNVLVGRVFGATELGYYTRAYLLMMLPLMATRSVTAVLVPALSRLQADNERFGEAYRKSLRAVAFVAMPIGIGLLLTSAEVVRLLYGEGWYPVVPILSWLAIAGVLQPIQTTAGWIYIPRGHIKAMLVVTIAFAVLIVSAFFLGLPWGPVGIAAAYTVVSVLISGPALYIPHRLSGLSMRRSLQVLRPIGVASLIMAVSVLLADRLLDTLGAEWLLAFATKVVVGAVVYGVIAVRWMRPFPIPLPGRIGQWIAARQGR